MVVTARSALPGPRPPLPEADSPQHYLSAALSSNYPLSPSSTAAADYSAVRLSPPPPLPLRATAAGRCSSPPAPSAFPSSLAVLRYQSPGCRPAPRAAAALLSPPVGRRGPQPLPLPRAAPSEAELLQMARGLAAAHRPDLSPALRTAHADPFQVLRLPEPVQVRRPPEPSRSPFRDAPRPLSPRVVHRPPGPAPPPPPPRRSEGRESVGTAAPEHTCQWAWEEEPPVPHRSGASFSFAEMAEAKAREVLQRAARQATPSPLRAAPPPPPQPPPVGHIAVPAPPPAPPPAASPPAAAAPAAAAPAALPPAAAGGLHVAPAPALPHPLPPPRQISPGASAPCSASPPRRGTPEHRWVLDYQCRSSPGAPPSSQAPPPPQPAPPPAPGRPDAAAERAAMRERVHRRQRLRAERDAARRVAHRQRLEEERRKEEAAEAARKRLTPQGRSRYLSAKKRPAAPGAVDCPGAMNMSVMQAAVGCLSGGKTTAEFVHSLRGGSARPSGESPAQAQVSPHPRQRQPADCGAAPAERAASPLAASSSGCGEVDSGPPLSPRLQQLYTASPERNRDLFRAARSPSAPASPSPSPAAPEAPPVVPPPVSTGEHPAAAGGGGNSSLRSPPRQQPPPRRGPAAEASPAAQPPPPAPPPAPPPPPPPPPQTLQQQGERQSPYVSPPRIRPQGAQQQQQPRAAAATQRPPRWDPSPARTPPRRDTAPGRGGSRVRHHSPDAGVVVACSGPCLLSGLGREAAEGGGDGCDPAVREWLQGLQLGRYAGLFAAHYVDWEALALLREQDLGDMGLPMGPRRKVAVAAAALRSQHA
eukprot:TRINITY_DN11481_c0_g1_i5.p1 TRINITY_DN11481_c0_g1~~TRINITY_DN11481_c0_g1_i5.p1  ORF type:complete len:837 (+),score=170.31 TRINITY_DN11481_c0_g1_i5:65-2512(+)